MKPSVDVVKLARASPVSPETLLVVKAAIAADDSAFNCVPDRDATWLASRDAVWMDVRPATALDVRLPKPEVVNAAN